MINNQKNILNCLVLLLLVIFASACTRSGTVKHMRAVSSKQIDTKPEHGKSMVIFIRPYSKAYDIQSSVFKVDEDDISLVGIVAAMKKVAYQIDPGEHLFMIVGENADFMSAKVEADRTYYAVILPRMGLWKARFSLKPVQSHKLNSEELSLWVERCEWVEKTSDSDQWARNNMKSIKSKYYEYFEDWMEKSESDRPKLKLHDGKLTKTLKMNPLTLESDDLNNYYSPQDAVDSFDKGEDGYYSPQDSDNLRDSAIDK